MDLGRVSLGLPGATDRDILAALAPRVEAAGFRALWLNDTPGGDSLEGLAVAAGATSTLRLGTGVIAIDRRSVDEIVAGLSGLPSERVTLGIGSGGAPHPVALVGDAVTSLRKRSDVAIVVGALGPRMRRLAAERADGVLLNWLTLAAAAAAREDLRRDSGGSGRAVLYARTIVDAAASPALVDEALKYGRIPSYAANLERIGARAIDTTIDGSDSAALAAAIDGFTAEVDELVLRAIVADPTVEGYERFIDTVVEAGARAH